MSLKINLNCLMMTPLTLNRLMITLSLKPALNARLIIMFWKFIIWITQIQIISVTFIARFSSQIISRTIHSPLLFVFLQNVCNIFLANHIKNNPFALTGIVCVFTKHKLCSYQESSSVYSCVKHHLGVNGTRYVLLFSRRFLPILLLWSFFINISFVLNILRILEAELGSLLWHRQPGWGWITRSCQGKAAKGRWQNWSPNKTSPQGSSR